MQKFFFFNIQLKQILWKLLKNGKLMNRALKEIVYFSNMP